MGFVSSRARSGEPAGMHAHALANLQFIRDTMEGATAFTAVSGWGMVVAGCTAFAAAAVASRQRSLDAWLLVWLVEAFVSVLVIVLSSVHKAKSTGTPLFGIPAKKFVLSFSPPMIAGALMTVYYYRADVPGLYAGTWLLLFGAATIAGGAFSVKAVPLMGLCFMLAGAAALFIPMAWGDVYMAGGFGCLNVFFGFVIARRYGG